MFPSETVAGTFIPITDQSNGGELHEQVAAAFLSHLPHEAGGRAGLQSTGSHLAG